ncbi:MULTISPECIES: protoporphyrinogen oxidase [unclassified Streptomyces]|uniref:protoporphyrinogen oxidase n=1 Tax=unclassified Streptomyces TaxID=2593676 RepID=UPI00225B3779|nr:protoporphyrinogen oxidase [Streptomyces sp. NBC_01551]MCX4527168.1 protoporphyrinogen oxidase [Streptomyces sp. NBC_01551]
MAGSERDQASGKPHVVIIGGGIAGLSAAFCLRGEPVRVTLLEGSSRIGGKLSVSEVAGVAVDEGAESLYLNRRKTTGLIKEAGLGDRIMSAGVTASAIRTGNEVRNQPDRQFMGVPCDMDDLARSGVLSAAGLDRARQDLALPAFDRDGDVSVADFVGGRLGREVVDRLVEPFLAGVFSGRAEDLSFEATLGPLAMASRKHTSLADAAGSLVPQLAEGEKPPPVSVATLDGGFGSLPPALVREVLAAAPDASLRTDAPVRELARSANGWRVTVGTAGDPEYIDADAVIVAVPAGPASGLLAGVTGAGQAVSALAEVPYSSVAMVTLAYPREAFPGGLSGRGYSAYRVPAVEGKVVKEVTFTTVKWPHLAGEVEIVRCSLGRFGEDHLLGRDDADLVAVAAAELAEATGVTGVPVASRVSRWQDALPQYTVGHLARVERIREAVAAQPGLAVCGALYDGVGVGVCMATARKAADQVLAWLKKDAAARSVAGAV